MQDVATMPKPTSMQRTDNDGKIRIIAVAIETRGGPPGRPGTINVPKEYVVYEGSDPVAARAIEDAVTTRMYEPNPISF